MKYSKKQLIKGMELYFKDIILNEDEYETELEGTIGEAKRTIERLIELIE